MLISLSLRKLESNEKLQFSKVGQPICCLVVRNWKFLRGGLDFFDKNLKLVGPCGSKQPKMEQSDQIGTKNEETEQDPKKKSAFSYFMDGQGTIQSVVLSKEIKSMDSEVIDLLWKSSDDDHLHCGVAMMRHMETYMGLQKWNSGLKKNNVSLSHFMLVVATYRPCSLLKYLIICLFVK
ncbi:uncharacterized protein LOC110694372 [Chenopodium quinoa]|uniref:uncharacterized protein LOC110694372 n=1 Tax=Chenopodium quinoa TaxID=63459 RepID=UPI000B770C87|nr:uncharacterized protein LOC110694372 [Chenopodium quinoa]